MRFSDKPQLIKGPKPMYNNTQYFDGYSYLDGGHGDPMDKVRRKFGIGIYKGKPIWSNSDVLDY